MFDPQGRRPGDWRGEQDWKSEEDWTQGAVVLCVRKDGYVCAVRRGSQNWNLPGGKAQGREVPYDAARRELYEETGLVTPAVGGMSLRDKYDDNGRAIYLYRCTSWYGSIRDSEEGAVEWLPRAMLLTEHCTFAKSNRTLLEEL